MPNVLVSGDILLRGLVLDDLPSDCIIARLGDLIVAQRKDLTQNFAFYRNKECTDECDLTDPVSSLGVSNGFHRVYIRAIAGAYPHEPVAIPAFSRLQD